MNTTTCADCGITYGLGASPWCSHKHEPMSSVRQPAVTYPGGLTLYNMGPTPVTVYSETERQSLMRERGLREAVYHIPSPDSDQSPQTRSWDTPCAYTMEQARILVSRQGQPRDPDAGRLDSLQTGWEFNPVKAVVRA
jgi:hypothetical protein